jgi:cystathionine beta-lyase
MRIYNFGEPPNRLGSDCLKWDVYGPAVIPLWVADMDFVSPEPVIKALTEKVEHGVFGYPSGIMGEPSELPELRSAIIGRMADRYNWEIKPEDILFIPGVVTGFNLANHAFVPDGHGVLIQTPVYPPILKSAETTGKLYQAMELDRNEDGLYGVDWGAMEESITANTRVFILCNPHNPVGKVFSRAELERTAELCLRKGVLICSDEIHCDLIFEGYKHIPIASIDREVAQSTITLMAPSKTYNIAGLQCSFAIIQNENLRKCFTERSGFNR